MVGTQETMKTFKKILVLVSPAPTSGQSFNNSSREKYLFSCSSSYMHLLYCRAVYRFKDLFKLKKMTYYLSIHNIYVCVYIYIIYIYGLGRVITFITFRCFARCREDKTVTN